MNRLDFQHFVLRQAFKGNYAAPLRKPSRILDVGSGTGRWAKEIAALFPSATVTGIDIKNPASDEQNAVSAAPGKHLASYQFIHGNILEGLPFPDASFSIVVSRFAFHHFPDPRAVLADMKRVCTPGGRVILADAVASTDQLKAAAFNRMEKLRDPSHVRALTLAELTQLFADVGLPTPRAAFYELRSDLEGLLERSFPASGDADRIRQMFVDSLADDGLGMATRRHGDRIVFVYPVAILTASAAASPPRTQSGMPTPR